MKKSSLHTFITTLALASALLPLFSQSAQAQPSFETLAEKLLPTVVNVSTTTKLNLGAQQAVPGMPEMPQLPQLPPGSPFEDFFKEFYDRFKNMPTSPSGEENVSALGSGFVVDAEKGYIVTNNHVIKDADEIKVILHDNTTLDATRVGVDEKTDLAVLKVTPKKGALVATTWGNSDESKVGSWVLAIGNPFGLGGTVTAGIISARQRDISAGPYDDFIQTDASINRGNSGGPMFNTKGEVIGVNTAIFSPSGGSVGIGFAVPSSLAKNVVDQLIKYGQTKRGWLGVRIQEVTPEIAESLGLPSTNGALVSDVTKGGPSEKAGIEAGDVILSFDNHDIGQLRQLPRLVAESEVGKEATLTLWHKGQKKTVKVALGQLESAEEEDAAKAENGKPSGTTKVSSTAVPALGLSLASIDDSLRKTYDIEKNLLGVVITEVTKGSDAAEKGLMAGDVIIEADQQETAKPSEILARVEAAKKEKRNSVLLFLARKGDRRFVAVKIKE
jgi:serine protease Do